MLPVGTEEHARGNGTAGSASLARRDRPQRVPLPPPPPPPGHRRAARRRPTGRERRRRARRQARRDHRPLRGDRRAPAGAAPGGDPPRLLRALLPRGLARARGLRPGGRVAAVQEQETAPGASCTAPRGERSGGGSRRRPRGPRSRHPGILERPAGLGHRRGRGGPLGEAPLRPCGREAGRPGACGGSRDGRTGARAGEALPGTSDATGARGRQARRPSPRRTAHRHCDSGRPSARRRRRGARNEERPDQGPDRCGGRDGSGGGDRDERHRCSAEGRDRRPCGGPTALDGRLGGPGASGRGSRRHGSRRPSRHARRTGGGAADPRDGDAHGPDAPAVDSTLIDRRGRERDSRSRRN